VDVVETEETRTDPAASSVAEEVGQRIGLERDMQAALRIEIDQLEQGLTIAKYETGHHPGCRLRFGVETRSYEDAAHLPALFFGGYVAHVAQDLRDRPLPSGSCLRRIGVTNTTAGNRARPTREKDAACQFPVWRPGVRAEPRRPKDRPVASTWRPNRLLLSLLFCARIPVSD
jgi:hypothetical protein